MAGKILKVSANDVYGKVDERIAVVFACFEHTKYMNNYVIFSFLGEYDKNKLCYGSIHMKRNSVVIFSVKDNVKQYIDEFINEYENNKIDNFKILDISDKERVEIVSYNEMDYNKLELLDEMSIFREVVQEEVVVKEKQPVFLYSMLVVLILFACGLTLLYFKPELFSIKYKQLLCTNNLYDNEMELNYDIEKDVKFDKIQDGGHQERNKRAGTENVAGIVGLGKAIEMAYRDFNEYNKSSIFQIELFY